MANRFWVAGTGNWSDDTNHWATTTGGAAGGGNKPGASDTGIFDGNSGGGTCTLDEAPSITALDMQTGNTTTVTTSGSDFALTTSGAFTLTAGVFTANGSTITVGANCVVADVASLFAAGTSTVSITGTGNLSNTRGTNAFNNLTFSGAITTTLITNITVNGTFTTGTGTIQDDGTARILSLAGAMTNQGPTWTVATGLKINWTSTTAQTIPADDYGSVEFAFIGAGPFSFGGNVTCAAVTAIAQGGLAICDMVTHDFVCTSIMIGGNNSGANGEIDCGSGTLTCTGNLTIKDSDFTVTGRENCINGESATINVGGTWLAESTTDKGLFMEGTSTVVFDATSGTNDITSGGNNFNNITLDDAAGTAVFRLLDDMIVKGNFLITDGTFNATTNSARITFSGTGTQTVTVNGETVNLVTASNVGGSVVFADLLTTADKLTVNAATVTLKESVTHVIDEIEWRGTPGSLASIDSGDAASTATINLTTDSRATYTAIDHITVITQKVDALKERGCTDGGNNGGFAADVGVNFGFGTAVNPFLTTPILQHEVTTPSGI